MSFFEKHKIPKPQHMRHREQRLIVSTVQRQVRIPHPLFQQWETYKASHPHDSLNGRFIKLLTEFLQLYNVKPPDLSIYPAEAGNNFPPAIEPPAEEE